MTSEELMDKLIGGHIKGRAKKGYCSMGGFKAVLTFDDSWDADSVRNTLADYDHVPGVTVSALSECNEVARQNKGSAEQQTDNSESDAITEVCKRCANNCKVGDKVICGAFKQG